MKKFLKAVAALGLIFAAFIITALSGGFTCGPHVLDLGDLFYNSTLTSEDGSALIRTGVGEGVAAGYFTDSGGRRVEACFDMGDPDRIWVYMPYAPASEQNEYFRLDAVCTEEAGETFLECTVVENSVHNVQISFTSLMFTAVTLPDSVREPYFNFYGNGLYSEDGLIYVSPYTNSAVPLSRRAALYYFGEDGEITYTNAIFCWSLGGFKVFSVDGDGLPQTELLYGDYVQNPPDAADPQGISFTLTIKKDGLYGQNKPFSSYPQIVLYY